MKVLVCGGRNFNDLDLLYASMDTYHAACNFTQVIHGCAKGADKLAGAWARDNSIPELRFPAEWNKYGPRAGHIRNQQMLNEGKPDLVIAFPGGTGTADMVKRATKAGLKVIRVA